MTLAKEIAKGAAWVLFFKLISRSLGMVSIVILARLLAPADFGLVALAMAMIAALELAGNFSFDIALIQNQNATRQHYDTVWTISLLFHIGIALMLAASAFPLATLFTESQLGPALLTLSILPILDGLQNIRVVDFRKKMMFHKDFTFLLSKRIIGFTVTIPLAFYLRNHWALIIGAIAGRFGGVIFSYLLIPYKPKLGTEYWRELFSFSKWLFANNILHFLRHRASSFIIGKLSGIQSLGVFEISNQISIIPLTEFVAPINRAVLPGFSKINDDLRELGDNYIRIVGMISLLAAPAGIGIAAIAEPLVHAVLGNQWLDAIPIITILGVVAAISCTESNTGTTCIAVGRPDMVAKLNAFFVAVLMSLTIWFTSKWGITGAAWAWLLTVMINIPVFYTVTLRIINIRALRFVAIAWRPVLSSIIMFVGIRWFLEIQPDISGTPNALPILFESTALGILIYGSSIVALWCFAGRPKGAEQDVWNQVASRITFPGGRN